jgi:hypothetical protein
VSLQTLEWELCELNRFRSEPQRHLRQLSPAQLLDRSCGLRVRRKIYALCPSFQLKDLLSCIVAFLLSPFYLY